MLSAVANFISSAVSGGEDKPVTLTIKTLGGNKFDLVVESSIEVESFKQKLFQLDQEIPVEEMKPIWAGKVLEKGKRIRDYNIPDKSVVILLRNLEDGASQAEVELDLVFVVDCTGSMSSYIMNVQTNMRFIIEEVIASERANVRFALVKYRDLHKGEQYATRVSPFTEDLSKMQEYVQSMSAGGGGDAPECLASGLDEILQMEFRDTATKVCVLVTDAPPHGLEANAGDSYPDGDAKDKDLIRISHDIVSQEIRMYAVGCEPSINGYIASCSWMRWAAERTGGRYVPLTDAKLLAQVIVAGCREQLNYDRFKRLVQDEVAKLPSTEKPNAAKIAEVLNQQKVRLLSIYYEETKNDQIFKYMHVFDDAKDLAQAKTLCSSSSSAKTVTTPAGKNVDVPIAKPGTKTGSVSQRVISEGDVATVLAKLQI